MKKVEKYCRVWLRTTAISLSRVLATRTASLLFLAGKCIRFFLFIYFINVLQERVSNVSGYSGGEIIIFYLVFNVFDSIGQIFFRGIYWFRQQVISGDFDFLLVKPVNTLFQVLTRETDLLDIPLLLVSLIGIVFGMREMSIGSPIAIVLATIASLGLITAIHIFVAGFGLITTEVDHLMWVYRDVSLMTRFPADIYNQLIRGILTFVIPVGLIFTYPAKAILGFLSLGYAVGAVGISSLFFITSVYYWRYALKKYQGASS